MRTPRKMTLTAAGLNLLSNSSSQADRVSCSLIVYPIGNGTPTVATGEMDKYRLQGLVLNAMEALRRVLKAEESNATTTRNMLENLKR